MTIEARFMMTIEIGYCYMQYMYMWYWSVLVRLSIEQHPGLLLYSCYWKLLGKYCRTVTHSLFHCSAVYTVILFISLFLHYWYCYCHRIIPVIEITWILIDLNNNVNW